MLTLPLKPFYFIRHGETDWNHRNIIMGQSDIPLNELGTKQAIEARKLFKNIEFDNIYTSPLKRAFQTAEILNQDAKYSIIIKEGLKERKWGEKEGCLHNNPLSSLKDSELPKGAEKWDEFELRILTAIKEILEISSGTPLIAAHAGIFIVLVKHFNVSYLRANNCAAYFFSPQNLKDYSWNILNLSDES